MPWTANDALRHTKKANTPEKRKTWAEVANKALASGDSEGSAIRQANAVIAGMSHKKQGDISSDRMTRTK